MFRAKAPMLDQANLDIRIRWGARSETSTNALVTSHEFVAERLVRLFVGHSRPRQFVMLKRVIMSSGMIDRPNMELYRGSQRGLDCSHCSGGTKPSRECIIGNLELISEAGSVEQRHFGWVCCCRRLALVAWLGVTNNISKRSYTLLMELRSPLLAIQMRKINWVRLPPAAWSVLKATPNGN